MKANKRAVHWCTLLHAYRRNRCCCCFFGHSIPKFGLLNANERTQSRQEKERSTVGCYCSIDVQMNIFTFIYIFGPKNFSLQGNYE